MEVKLNREEILCLIENIGDVAIMLGNDYIDVTVENQKYNKFLTELDIPDVKWIAERYIRNIATTFDYENYVNYKFEFDEITISSKIHKNESWYGHQIGLNENEIDMFIDNRFEKNENCDCNGNYNCNDDDYPYVDYDEEQAKYSSENTTEDDIIDDMFEEQERRDLKDLETYEEQVRESDEINYKIQAEMEQYMFENGKDYEDYQEPQLYDTEDNLVDSLNNDLDDCLSKE